MSETLARSLIKLIVTVGILAAVYFFMIRPILDTTNDRRYGLVSPFFFNYSTMPGSTHPT